MPARSIGTATISFGLVSVPVSIYSASESKASVSFNMLHKKCGTRLKQQYICPKDNNEVVTRDETVKGYEFAKDQYVVLTAEELKALEEKATSTIDVLEFVPLATVDREYMEKVYYLGPDKGGDRAYRLLAAALPLVCCICYSAVALADPSSLVIRPALLPVSNGVNESADPARFKAAPPNVVLHEFVLWHGGNSLFEPLCQWLAARGFVIVRALGPEPGRTYPEIKFHGTVRQFNEAFTCH